MKTFKEAVATFSSDNVTEEDCVGKWRALLEEIASDEDTREFVATYAMRLDQVVAEWIKQDLKATRTLGNKSCLSSRVLSLMCKIMAQGVAIGIEMEKP